MVEAGDNPEAEVVIYKARTTPSKDDVVRVSDKAESQPKTQKVNMELSAIEDQELRKSVEDTIAEKDAKITELESQVSELTPEADPVEKADPEVKELIAKQQEKLDELEKDLDEERTTRRNAEYVLKAEPFAGLLGPPKEIGPVLADIAFKAPESFTVLVNALTAASQREEMGKLFATLGTSEGEGEADPISQRDVWVKENKTADETVEQAGARFWKENPQAVKESRS